MANIPYFVLRPISKLCLFTDSVGLTGLGLITITQ